MLRYGQAVANATDDVRGAGGRAERRRSHPPSAASPSSCSSSGPEATLLSAAALAEQLGTSDATVVRTAKALGYSGLAELRRALAAYGDDPPLGERLRRTLEQAPATSSSPQRSAITSRPLENLTRNVSRRRPSNTPSRSSPAADRIVWRGVGPVRAPRRLRATLTQRIGKPSTALVHTGTSFADELLTLAPDDAVVVFAYGRLQSHVRVLLERAATLAIPVVLITDTLGRKLDAGVHTTLQCGRGAPGLFASHGTTLVVVEALVLAVAAADQAKSEASLPHLNELRSALAGRRIDVDTP